MNWPELQDICSGWTSTRRMRKRQAKHHKTCQFDYTLYLLHGAKAANPLVGATVAPARITVS